MKRMDSCGAVGLSRLVAGAALVGTLAACAGEQVWKDDGADNVWSTNEVSLNWDYGAAWTNGNSAVFSGNGGLSLGETVDVAGDVVVVGLTFQTNGYVIADADANGKLTLAGVSNLFAVVNAGDTGTVSEVLAGSGGLSKTGAGQLRLIAANTYTGQTIVCAGTLRLNPSTRDVLGATGAGNETVVEAGATLDLNGCYAASSSLEAFQIAGAGVDGKGALVNYGANHNNNSVGSLTLLGSATVNSERRIDANTFYGNGHTLTKIGAEQFCVRNLTDAEIVINQGVYTLLDDWRALGGTTPGNTTMNAGTLNAWNTMTVPERITFNGGRIQQGNPNRQLLTLTGYLTLNSMVTISSGSITSGVEVAGFVDGAGGFACDQGWIYITGNTNTYSGPTIVNGGRYLHVGKTNLYSGLLGSGAVTNNGTLYAYSGLITKGSIVNNGTLNSYTGLLCSGRVVNNGNLYFDRRDAFTLTNDFSGGGTLFVRHAPSVTLSGGASTNAGFRFGSGTLTLTNNAFFRFTGEMQVADRFTFSPSDPTNVTAVINVTDGCTLMSQAITFGNGLTVTGGGMTGILNQTGGLVHTTGKDGGNEGNGIRLGHYPQAFCTYNLMGGTLIVATNADLGCATDGTGWFNMTGGEVFTTRVMLNEREGGGGNGRLTIAGGVLNLGTLDASVGATTNAITADAGAPYTVQYGGAGGTVRAVTNIFLPLHATLFGAGASAITFDSQAASVSHSGTLSGAGGLNKAGAGVMTLSAQNSYSGATFVAEGRLLLGVANAVSNSAVTVGAGAVLDLGGFGQKVGGAGGSGIVSNGALTVAGAIEPGVGGIGTLTIVGDGTVSPGGVLTVDVASDGTSDVLHVPGDLSLDGMSLQVADPGQLQKGKAYTVVTCGGELSGRFSSVTLPDSWYVFMDWDQDAVQLRSDKGTLIRVR